MNIIIEIDKEPSFTEVWYEGSVFYGEDEHKFWLVHPQNKDRNEQDYEIEVRWFFAKVPREIRAMRDQIIEAFKQTLK
jgi:hypothetical protein